MSRFSVKKPYTVLVAVALIIVLGFVALRSMAVDLLPKVSLPYLIVVVTDPGASSENVEHDVASPLESALGTINGVKNLYSMSYENYCLVQLEFESNTNMDTALMKVTTSLNTVESRLPDNAGTPQVVELSMDMVATMYAAVSRDGADIYQISDFTENNVVGEIQRCDGVADVSATGLIEKSVQVELNKDKIEAVNARILEFTNEKLAAAQAELDSARAEVEQGEEELASRQAAFGATMSQSLSQQLMPQVSDLIDRLSQGMDRLSGSLDELEKLLGRDGYFDDLQKQLAAVRSELEAIDGNSDPAEVIADLQRLAADLVPVLDEINAEIERLSRDSGEDSQNALQDAYESIRSDVRAIKDGLASLPGFLDGLTDMAGRLSQAQLDAAVGFSAAMNGLTDARAALDKAQAEFDAQKETALQTADMSKMVNATLLSQLIAAQNFEMPAGYIKDEADLSWLIKVGKPYMSTEELADTVLTNIEGYGDIRIGDIAEVTVIDNAGQSYAKMNGADAVILSVFKSGSSGTNATARACLEAFDELEDKYEGLHFTVLMNQGEYITMIINSVLSSMLTGAVLAIIVLALFLKDVRPTLVVAISIPLSVMLAIIAMYFSNLSMNMMTLSGLALGIGMLVDNSIVVMENIYRLRSKGIPAPRAAVQGTRQVAGAIISSTATTVCVFVPMLFTNGTIREMLMPLGLTITYTLTSSLLIAMTVVPASASTILKNTRPKQHRLLERIQTAYGRLLAFFLGHKALPISAAVALLALTTFAVTRTGISLLPEMGGGPIQVTVNMPEGITRADSYEVTDNIMSDISALDGVKDCGFMTTSSAGNMIASVSLTDDRDYMGYTGYVLADGDLSRKETKRIAKKIEALADKYGAVIRADIGGMTDLAAYQGTGLTVNIYGPDQKTLENISSDVMDMVRSTGGFEEPDNGLTNGDPTIFLRIDRNKAMEKGITVAEIYQSIAADLINSASNTSIHLDDRDMSVKVVDNTGNISREDLLEHEITVKDSRYKLSDFASVEEGSSLASVNRRNLSPYMTVSAATLEGRNTTLLSRRLQKQIDSYDLPSGYIIEIEGETQQVNEMVGQMSRMILLAVVMIYCVMVAQFQSLLSPFIVMFTMPLAFTGGMAGLMIAGQQLNMLSLVGFLILMGTVVNNGIVFVDYANQLRKQGLDRRAALIAAGKTRMRPIWMTALTTILAMFQLIFGDDLGSQMSSGMAIVVAGGLLYATLMTLFIVPVFYDIFFKRQPLDIDVGTNEELDSLISDAADYMQSGQEEKPAEAGRA